MNLNRTVCKYKDTDIKAVLFSRHSDWEKLFITEIWVAGYYNTRDFNIKEGDIVLDIGGHIGTFAILAAKMGATVYCYEPVPENYELIKLNVRENKLEDKIKVFNLAITPTGGKMKMLVANPDLGQNTGASRVVYADHEVSNATIDSITIDGALNSLAKCDFMKVDCEGSEYPMFYGAASQVFNKTKLISMEFHFSLQEGTMLKNFLTSKGYEVWLDWSYGTVGKMQARKR